MSKVVEQPDVVVGGGVVERLPGEADLVLRRGQLLLQREQFPASLIAGLCGFGPAQLFEVESPKEREAPRVSF